MLHFVLQCPKYSLSRRVYFGPLGRVGQRLDYLLSNKKGTQRLFKYVHVTRRLHQTFGDLKTAEQDDRNGGGRGSRSDNRHRSDK